MSVTSPTTSTAVMSKCPIIKPPCITQFLLRIVDVVAGPAGIQPKVSRQAVLPGPKTKPEKTNKEPKMSSRKKQEEFEQETTHNLRLYLEYMLGDLSEKIGVEKTEEVYKCRVKRHHFLFIYVDEDRGLGEKLRDQLKTQAREMKHEVSMAGPWDVKLGDITPAVWEHLYTTSQIVVVLASKALFKDRFVTRCLTNVDESRITPVYLERLEYKDFPPEVLSLRCRNGHWTDNSQCNLKGFVRSLLNHYNFHDHLVREIKTLGAILNT